MAENQALSSALGTDMKPAPFKEPDYSKITTLPQVFAEEKRIGDLQAKTAGELKRAELTQQQNIAGEQAKAATEVANTARTYVQESQKKEAEFPYPEFHPTKDNAESLAGLFSIVSTLGVMLGSSGKQSGLNAMGAMTGMMNGWQKGRADLFKREKEEFDKEFGRIKVLREGLRKDLEDYMKLLPYDKEAAMYKAAEISAKTGTDSIISAYVAKGQADNAIKLLDSAGKMIQHKEDKEAQDRRSAAERAQREKFQKESLALQRERIAAMERRGARGGAAQETSMRVMQQDIGNAAYNLEDLKEAGEKAGKLPGGSVAFANYFKGDIKSDIIRYATNQFVETDLQSNDALMLNLAFDIASAQSGGRGQLSDSKVRAVVAQMPLDEQPEDTKATKWAALMVRVKEANKTLPEDKRVEIPKQLEEYYMGRRMGRGEGESGKTDSVTGLPLKNSKGYTLENDGAGNYAYVSPDRKTFEEVE